MIIWGSSWRLIADVETSYAWKAQSEGLEIAHELKHHRDGSVSFYIRDPDGNLIRGALQDPPSVGIRFWSIS